jgi:DNA-binding NarL/FixJ family response regulator
MMSDRMKQGRGNNEPLRVLLANGSPVERNALREAMLQMHFVEIVGETDTCNEALELLFRLRPDVVISAIHLGNEGGFELLRRCKRVVPQTVVILTSRLPNHFVEQAARILGAALVCPIADLLQLRVTLRDLWHTKSGAAARQGRGKE